MLFPNVKIRKKPEKNKSSRRKLNSLKICGGFLAIVLSCAFLSCRQTEPTEMRRLLPNNAVAYLETKDLGATLDALTASQAFLELAEDKPNFSRLRQMQIAVAVTNFDAAEANGALNFKPQFVAVAETNLWSWQTRSFAENQLDSFVRRNYGADAALDVQTKDAGKFYHWTAADNRQVFAFVEGSLIYFATDQATIEQCLTVKKEAAESLLKNEALSAAYTKNNLAFGYVSTEGIKRVADFAGINLAVETTEDADGRAFIARLLPQILQNTAREIVWTANRTEIGIEDKFRVALTPETAAVVRENFAAGESSDSNLTQFLPADFYSATRYNLRNPPAAWRGLLVTAARNADQPTARTLIEFSGKLLEPYGISDAEKFLNSVDSEIITTQIDADAEKTIVLAAVKNLANLKSSIAPTIDFRVAPQTENGAEIWFSVDRKAAAAFVENKLILGDGESVLRCVRAKEAKRIFLQNSGYQKFAASRNVAATFGKDADSAAKVVNVLAREKRADRKLATFFLTETNFSEMGIERKTRSDFGLLGTLIANLDS